MSLQGDLSTLDLSGLLQNLETAQKSGLLTVQDGEGETQLYFHHGKLALIAYPSRPELVDILLASGAVTARELEVAKKRKKRSKKTLIETFAALGVIQKERLAQVAAARLTDEACELINAGAGAFTFTEGGIPRNVFDPEERALGITLAASPLLLEAARRTDHWRMIRERVPSDSAHYVVQRAPRPAADAHIAQLQVRMCELLDGTRNVGEVVAAFPHRRFEAYQVLADLAESQSIRVAAPTDLHRQIEELARHDKERAWTLLERSLEANPRSLNLLCTKALLAEEIGKLEEASEALKLVVHLHLEAGAGDQARTGLEQLKDLDPDDPFVWEKSFELALAEERESDAIRDGKKLVELYKEPGLFKKACGVLERLVELTDGSWELVRELAHARADAGERDAAVAGLEAHGATKLAAEEYVFARKVYEEVLAIDPERASAKETIEEIKSGELAGRRARWRRVRRRVTLLLAGAIAVLWLTYEGAARRAYVRSTREVSREGLIEAGRYAEALERFAQVRARYPWATTSLYDVRRQVAELEAKLTESQRLSPGL